MKNLTIAFYAEGPTDYRFLPIIIQRTAEKLLCENNCGDTSVLMPISFEKSFGDTSAEKILNIAKNTTGFDLLIVHLDADGRDLNLARQNRFEPGRNLVEDQLQQTSPSLIPIIPIKNIESWMLCDYAAFKISVGTKLSARELGIPSHPHEVESITDPKQTFQNAVRKAIRKRRKRGNINTASYYEPLGREIELSKLESVPSYVSFKDELFQFLQDSNFIPANISLVR